MARNVNRVTLVGNLGQDPELRATQGGNRVANLSMATKRNRKDGSGEWQSDTEWHRIVAWGDYLCDTIDRDIMKGTLVYVEGRIQSRKWTDRENTEHTAYEIIASAVIPLGDKKPREEEVVGAGARTAPEPVINDDDLPF